ncbi:2,3-bisphosphoglycerate-independent phosphoglycerate mutase [Bermanella marisrubri]|uniref:2,3-bisphosphoglycerate-independent phosphoglycerate mutase n=1 Tax=Bermanella marisrubri TaxID=207949 RepID=Q1N4E6_9GAMM|nr:2,3-bisphosphoglycerate-independent phosphoglycerate mutase [Bermanella marisrubri]EAT12919.1 2,3-bisphosphoglycerate-independent phosphoglycerate mutase [Oceanobacter sp. RED65] [Bermanella marisrubri]QIZ82950.1 2,3-bisphosphoglycerate-independent phosphoglycerate mutase [Bermanella marisrubri]
MSAQPKPVALIILDGFGERDAAQDNAITTANMPTWNRLVNEYPHVQINTSGAAVGLPDGQMGNSEVGHMNLGAGRIVYQNYTRINKAISDGEFQQNAALTAAMDKAISAGKAVHLMGLLSPGGVHSHQDHIMALASMAKDRGAKQIYVHAILDGRDVAPQSAKPFLETVSEHLAGLDMGDDARIVNLIGRYYAMDRDNRWERVQRAYDMYTQGKAEYQAASAIEGLEASYDRDEHDEFVKDTIIGDAVTINDGDSVIFANFRPDRAREITRAFVEQEFNGFSRTAHPTLSDYVMMTEYAADIETSCAFPPASMKNDLGEYVSNLGKTQLRIAETEKYAHVTFFFSGGQEAVYPGEERILINSPDVATYDLKPEMSAPEVTDKLVDAIENQKYDLIVCNFANGDMVGHTGVMDAAVKACEALDTCLKRVTDAIIKVGGECLITADHGNCEQMTDANGGPMTQHTTGPVPLVHVSKKGKQVSLKQGGALCDIAPTLLTMMGETAPEEMTGQVLVKYE